MRKLAALSTVALSALLLAGCAGSPDETATPEATDGAQCSFDLPAGADSDAVTVSGDAPAFSVEVPEGLELAEMQRTVISEGDGPDLAVGDFISGAYSFFDAATGEALQSSADMSAEESGLVPIILDLQQASLATAGLECLPLGSTAVVTIPSSMLGEGAPNIIVVASSSEELPLQATGEQQPPVDGMPTVEFAENGEPTVTIPEGDAPTAVELENLRTGDGPVVESGDRVYVHYAGVKWSDGTVFDSSWERGAPSAFQTTGVVAGFQQALEGQTVGSQVVVVIPPEFGYGASEGHELQQETLVFVVDILGTEHAPQA